MSPNEAQKTARKASIKREHARVLDYINTFQGHHGKKVLFDMMAVHYMLTPLVAGNSDSGPVDPILMAYREGQRSVIGRILNLIKVDPNKFEQLLEEANDSRTSNPFA